MFEMPGSHELFYIVPQGIAFISYMAIVAMVMAILAQVRVRWVLVLSGWGDEFCLQDLVQYARSGCIQGSVVGELNGPSLHRTVLFERGRFFVRPPGVSSRRGGLSVALVSSHVFDSDKHGLSSPKLLHAQGAHCQLISEGPWLEGGHHIH